MLIDIKGLKMEICLICKKEKQLWSNPRSKSKYCSEECTKKADIARERLAPWFKDRNCKGDCNKCKRVFSYNELEVDHIVPHELGGQSIEDNLQLLCKPCHKEKTKEDLSLMRAVKLYKESSFSAEITDDHELILDKNNMPLRNS